MIKAIYLIEGSLLHSCSIPFEEGGSANGVLITDKSRGPGGDDESVLSKPLGREHFIRNEAGTLSGQRLIRGVCGSFCVALRSEPSNLAVAAHPIVNVSFAGKAADNPNFRARDTGFNLPVGFGDPFRLEYDARRFTHAANMPPHGADS